MTRFKKKKKTFAHILKAAHGVLIVFWFVVMHMSQSQLHAWFQLWAFPGEFVTQGAVDTLHHHSLRRFKSIPRFYGLWQCFVSTNRNQKLRPPLRCGLFFLTGSAASSFMSNIPWRKWYHVPDGILSNATLNCRTVAWAHHHPQSPDKWCLGMPNMSLCVKQRISAKTIHISFISQSPTEKK